MTAYPAAQPVPPAEPGLGGQYHDPVGCHWGGIPHLGACWDRGREAGRALTEIRSVLSRAETAYRMLTERRSSGKFEALERPRLAKPPGRPGVVDAGEPPIDPDGVPFDDPDLPIMTAALRQVIGLLRPWQRSGKTTHWVAEDGYAQLVTSGPPEWFDVEVGDEMFTGQQAVLAETRRRLAMRLLFDPAVQRVAVGVVDEQMREMVEQERDDDEEGEDG